jgi:hypothetical protein
MDDGITPNGEMRRAPAEPGAGSFDGTIGMHWGERIGARANPRTHLVSNL